MNKSLDSYVLYSGGAYGADRLFGVLSHKYGVGRQYHIRPIGNEKIHKDLIKLGLRALVADVPTLCKAADKINKLIGVELRQGRSSALLARNYYQVNKADSVLAVGYLNGTTVLGGTRMAVDLGIALELPVYVLDIKSESWYLFDYNTNDFVLYEGVPTLTRKFAGVGSRDIESYNVKDRNTGQWVPRKEYVGDDKARRINSMVEDVFIQATS